MAANYVLINQQTLNASSSSITFSSIPQTGYTDLVVKVSARSDRTGVYTNEFILSVNSGTSYSTMELYNAGGAASYGPRTASTYLFLGHAPGANATANTFGNTEIYIPNYTSSGVKTVSIDGTTEHNGTQVYQVLYAGSITNGTGISSITLDASGFNFTAGSSFSLYGVAAVGTTPTVVPKASGGDIIKNDGTYWYHAFLSSGIFVSQTNLTCDVLQVAGGGSGGYASYGSGGGGGAGGLLEFTSQALTTGSYVCTVGAGGAAVTSGMGNQGNNSQFSSLTASVGGGAGGGGAGNSSGAAGGNGGSGGGAQAASQTGGTPTSGQGYAGGLGATDNNRFASGGGGGKAGAGGNGANGGAPTTGGAGGAAYYSTLTDAMGSATGTGVSSSPHYYFAGGGGGGGDTNGTGGYGGGTGGAGTANTGGGGGGKGSGGGGNGGSGIIIIRYAM